MSETIASGRLCYEVRREPVFAAHCHCRTCQKVSGGPMTTAGGLHGSFWQFGQ